MGHSNRQDLQELFFHTDKKNTRELLLVISDHVILSWPEICLLSCYKDINNL